MLKMIYGRAGSGKSDEIFRRASIAAENRHVFILVPDRDAVSAERRVSKLSGAGNIDVVTFRRLCNYVFRSLGGICENYIGAGEKKIVMQCVIEDMKENLSELSGASSTDTYVTETIIAARREMMMNMISPEELYDASLRIPGKTGRKAADLSAVFSEFDSRVGKRWRDPDGIICAAASCEGVCGFFEKSDIFIDAFTSFTAPQYMLIEKMIAGSPDVTVSLSYLPDEDKDEPAFMTLRQTDEKIANLCGKCGVKKGADTFLRTPMRFCEEALSFLSENMWSSSRAKKARFDKDTSAVRVISAADPYAEAEAVATDISSVIHSGARLRDIAVISRDMEEYRGIIDAVLDRYEIPYFISEKADVSSTSLVKFIFCVLNMRERGFSADEFIKYIKTEFCPIDESDSFALENYIIKWKISGKRLLDDFVENPRGMGIPFTDDDSRRLDLINAARRTAVEPLERFFGVARNAITVKDNAEQLFDFLSSLGVPETLFRSSSEARERGDDAGASSYSKLWSAFCDALDGLVDAAGDRNCTPEIFRVYLFEMLSECDMGSIPTSVDRVLIADAVLARVDAKYVYIIGAYDGGFPRAVGDDGIFTEREKDELSRAGVEISSRLWRKLSEEMYHFYTSASSPSHRLTVSYPVRASDGGVHEKSIGLKRILELFPKVTVTEYEKAPITDKLYGRRASFDLAVKSGGVLGEALREYYENDPEYAERFRNAQLPFNSKKCRLEKESADRLFGKGVNTSPSDIEKYIKCRFSYFCDNVLKLSDDRPVEFNAVDIGTFMHKIMEITVRYAVENPDATDEEIDGVIKNCAADLLSSYIRDGISNRMAHLSENLCRSARAFVDETRRQFSQGKFRPVSFELKIDSSGEIAPLEYSKDGKIISVRGKIDRVDAYEGENGTLNVVVCDYKTGDEKFSASNVELGLNMQMLIYLLALKENGAKYYGKTVTPAGAVYLGIAPPEVRLRFGTQAEPKISRSGIMLADLEILEAADEDMTGAYLPASGKEISAMRAGKECKNLVSQESFDELLGKVNDLVTGYCDELCEGVADAKPTKTKQKDPCRYCRFAAICRSASIGDDDEEDSEN